MLSAQAHSRAWLFKRISRCKQMSEERNTYESDQRGPVHFSARMHNCRRTAPRIDAHLAVTVTEVALRFPAVRATSRRTGAAVAKSRSTTAGRTYSLGTGLCATRRGVGTGAAGIICVENTKHDTTHTRCNKSIQRHDDAREYHMHIH